MKFFIIFIGLNTFAMEKMFFDDESLWPKKELSICWENPSDETKEEQLIVKNRVIETWGKYSNLNFEDWEFCFKNYKYDIRIQISDEGAHTKGIGTELKNKTNGMVLNFSFENWNNECQKSEQKRKDCIESIAIHEFGHAIGLLHEHNRDDRPEECDAPQQGADEGTTIGEFDEDSIMNYCDDASYSNKLSVQDIIGVQNLYGKPDSLEDPKILLSSQLVTRRRTLITIPIKYPVKNIFFTISTFRRIKSRRSIFFNCENGTSISKFIPKYLYDSYTSPTWENPCPQNRVKSVSLSLRMNSLLRRTGTIRVFTDSTPLN